MDNIFRNYVSRGSFCAEQHGNRLFRKLACLDLQILMDDIEGIHLLAFVFMQTFYLNVKNGIRVQFQSLGVLQIGNKLSLLFCFHIQKLCKYGRVASFFQPSPMREVMRAESSGLQAMSQRRKVMPLVLLLKRSGYSL